MRKLYLVLFLIICSGLTFAEMAAVFPDLIRPQDIIIDKDRLFISDYPNVYIYSLKDFNLIKKFGKAGEGPGEFSVRPTRFKISVQPDSLLVNCDSKIFYFTKEGKLTKEVNTRGVGYYFFAFNNMLLGRKVIQEGNILYTPLFLYDSNLNPIKELSRIKPAASDQGYRAFHRSFNIQTSKNKIFVTLGTEFVVKIFDSNGKLLHVINREDPKNRVKINENHKKQYHEYMKMVPGYQTIKDQLTFPDYFPAIRTGNGLKYDYHGGNEKLYVLTRKKQNGKSECFIFDTQGKFLKKINLPLSEINVAKPCILDIEGGKLYQLIENEDTEEYELFVSGIPE